MPEREQRHIAVLDAGSANVRSLSVEISDGAVRYRFHDIPEKFRPEFQARWLEPGWQEQADAALKKFPLKNGNRITLEAFLKPGKADEIVGGVHDFDRNGRKSNNARGGALTQSLGDFERRMAEIDNGVSA